MEKQEGIFVQGGMLLEERNLVKLGYEVWKYPNCNIVSPDSKIVLQILHLSNTIIVMNEKKITYCDRMIVGVEDRNIIAKCYRGVATEPQDYFYISE